MADPTKHETSIRKDVKGRAVKAYSRISRYLV